MRFLSVDAFPPRDSVEQFTSTPGSTLPKLCLIHCATLVDAAPSGMKTVCLEDMSMFRFTFPHVSQVNGKEGKNSILFHTESKHTESKHTESKHAESKHTESKHTESKHTESKHTESKHTESKLGQIIPTLVKAIVKELR